MKPSRKEKKTAKPPTPRKTRLAHHFIAKLPPPGPATGEKVRRRSLKAGDTQWEITARPDAEYDYFDIGIREPNGDVLLIGQTWNEDDAKLLIAAGAALGAARNSDKGEMLQLRHSIDGVIDLWPARFAKKNLLPNKIVDHIYFAHFLTHAVLPAQVAQRTTGVPASLLIAEAVTEFGTEGREIGSIQTGTLRLAGLASMRGFSPWRSVAKKQWRWRQRSRLRATAPPSSKRFENVRACGNLGSAAGSCKRSPTTISRTATCRGQDDWKIRPPDRVSGDAGASAPAFFLPNQPRYHVLEKLHFSSHEHRRWIAACLPRFSTVAAL